MSRAGCPRLSFAELSAENRQRPTPSPIRCRPWPRRSLPSIYSPYLSTICPGWTLRYGRSVGWNVLRLSWLQAKKDVVALFNGLLRYCPVPPSGRFPAVDYLTQKRPDTLVNLAEGYENKDVANNCGTILRESFKHQPLAEVILYDEVFWKFFDYVQGGSFDIASDAFSTFRVSCRSYSSIRCPAERVP